MDADSAHYNLIGLQRAVAVKSATREAQQLLREGYAVDADRVIDSIAERVAAWTDDGNG